MAITGKKISELQELQQITGTEYLPVVDGMTNKKVSVGKLATKEDIGNINTILDKINGEVI